MFGEYTVLGVYQVPGAYTKYALVKCSCGSRKRYVAVKSLRSGHARSCGCRQRKAVTKHGLWKHPVYRCWRSMVSRCHNPNDRSYLRYGGKGITVCERWRDHINFIADMGPSYQPRLTIDRIDGTKGYFPENCRWATVTQQNRNRSQCINLTHCGKTMCLREWADATGICYGTLWERHKTGWSTERMLTTPPRKASRRLTY